MGYLKIQKMATAVRTTYSNVYNTSAKGTPAPVASGQAVVYSKPQTTQTTTYNSRGATAPPVSTASAGTQNGTVIVKTSAANTTAARITTPAVVATGNVKTTTTGTATTRITTPAVVATGNVKTTTASTTATRITTPAVVATGNVKSTTTGASTNQIGTPAVISGTSQLQVTRQIISKGIVTPAVGAYVAGSTAENNNSNDGLHTALDVAGFIPFVGDLADVANTILYAVEGDWANAGISFLAMVPGCDWASGTRLAAKAVRTVGGATIGTAAVVISRNSAEKAAKETVEKVSTEATEGFGDKLLSRIKELFGEGGSKLKIEEVIPPGSTHPVKVYTDGNAQINTGKIEIYMRGKIEQPSNFLKVKERIKELEKLKNNKPLEWTKEMERELKEMSSIVHNYERSKANGKLLVDAGIADTVENNELIAANILEAAKQVTKENTKIKSYFYGGNKPILFDSWWIIGEDNIPYCSTIIVIEVK